MRALWIVTGWEFLRYFKWKQELVGLLVGLFVGGLFAGGSALVGWARARERNVVGVFDPQGLSPKAPAGRGLVLVPVDPSGRQAAEAKVGKGEWAGFLTLEDADAARLLVAKEPSWQKDLEKSLGEARRAYKLRQRGIGAAEYEELVRPPRLEVVTHAEGRLPAGPARLLAGIAILVAQLMAILSCFALFFTNLTGEKQARVTEQVVTAIPSQTWMDGKIIAFSLHGLKGLATLGLWGALAAFGADRFLGSSIGASLGTLPPLSWVAALCFLFLGLLFWSAFYAGFAATVDDPNHSARSSLMLVPVLPVAFSLMLAKLPDAPLAKLLSWLPLTSMGMMPLRVVRGSAEAPEAFGSAVLLLAAFLLLRLLAGRVFRMSMLLYGQEPSWPAIWRVMKASG